jgi:hypothetical protein
MPSMYRFDAFASVNDSAARMAVGTLVEDESGKVYRYVQFKDAVTYAAGQPVVWAAATPTAVTNDISGGSNVGALVAGIALGVMTQNYYGFVLGKGYYSAVVTNGDDDIAAGDFLILGGSDGTCNSGTVSAADFGYALAADVDASNTVAALIFCRGY